MANTQAVCTSFKSELLNKEHDLNTDTFKIALYTSSATVNATTTAYSATNEVSGTGYTGGGATLSGGAIATTGTVAYIDFTDVSWTTASFTANAALIYNSSASNKAVMVITFGGDQTVVTGTFTIVFPAADSSNAILRLD
jgi:hypothetical protein|tara:strand:- start:372 stop:791 length:420 start_codon:yes stop_codon:yes gene_type:complete